MDEKAPAVRLELKLNADAVAGPAQKAATEANEIVTFFTNALTDADLTSQPEPKEPPFFNVQLRGPTMSADDRKTLYSNWILIRAFLELARGLKQSLEEAHLYIEAMKLSGKVKTLAEFDGDIAAARRRANRDDFGTLLERVNRGLREPTAFDAEFLSMQKIRNVLEHRAGIVGQQDVGANKSLELTLPRLGLFYMRDGREHEVTSGQAFDEETELSLKRVSRMREFKLGERINFTAAEFGEIAFACNLFAVDLASKLPQMPPSPEIVT